MVDLGWWIWDGGSGASEMVDLGWAFKEQGEAGWRLRILGCGGAGFMGPAPPVQYVGQRRVPYCVWSTTGSAALS